MCCRGCDARHPSAEVPWLHQIASSFSLIELVVAIGTAEGGWPLWKRDQLKAFVAYSEEHIVRPAVCTDQRQALITVPSCWLTRILRVRMSYYVSQAAEAAQAPIAIDESTLYGSFNPTTGKVDLTERRPQFLAVRRPASARDAL